MARAKTPKQLDMKIKSLKNNKPKRQKKMDEEGYQWDDNGDDYDEDDLDEEEEY